jgi:hypothetical protein
MRRPETNDTVSIPVIPMAKDSEGRIIEEKVEELIKAILANPVDNRRSKIYQQRISDAFKKVVTSPKQFKQFNALHHDNNLSREELLDELGKILSETDIDSNQSRSILRQNAVRRVTLFIVSILLIVTGFAMIIMPAPPSFEMFTVFYFNPNDGVTIMDLVSLLIIFGGVFLFVLNFGKK